jgi:hypothetical protein
LPWGRFLANAPAFRRGRDPEVGTLRAVVQHIGWRRRTDREATIPTFGELAYQVVASLKDGFKNEKHIAQWEMTLREYAAPLRLLRGDQIIVDDVASVLKPIWSTQRETVSRLRGRIER